MYEEERGFSSRDRRTTVQDGIESTLRTSQGKLEAGAALELLVAWWSRQFNKPLILNANAMGASVRSTFVDDMHNVEMIGSPEPVKLAEFSLRTLGFGDFCNVGMEEAKTLAYKTSPTSPPTPTTSGARRTCTGSPSAASRNSTRRTSPRSPPPPT
jgi:hypothetical protein